MFQKRKNEEVFSFENFSVKRFKMEESRRCENPTRVNEISLTEIQSKTTYPEENNSTTNSNVDSSSQTISNKYKEWRKRSYDSFHCPLLQ